MKRVILTLALLGLTACFETTNSDNVKPRAVYQSYSARYDANERNLYVTAGFYVGGSLGTSLKLVPPSQVTVDDQSLDHEQFLGSYYARDTYNMDFQANHSWRWIDQDGVSYSNSITLRKFDIKDAPSGLSRSHDYVVKVSSASPAESNDEWVLRVERTSPNGGSSYSEIKGSFNGANQVAFSVPELQSLQNGGAVATIVRKFSQSTQQHTAEGGSISGYFLGRRFPIDIRD